MKLEVRKITSDPVLVDRMMLSFGDFPNIIEDTLGEDADDAILGKDDHYGKKFFQRGQIRKIAIEITSYIGMAWDAEHFYATIKADGVRVGYISKDGSSGTMGGFISNGHRDLIRKKPIYDSTYRFEVRRELEPKELTSVRFKDSDPDIKTGKYLTNCFRTATEAVETALSLVKERFKGDRWRVYVDDCTTALRKTIYGKIGWSNPITLKDIVCT